jgi:oxygen-dependent protoporphyrinogen oxidase
MSHRVAVVGGGISGLAAANALCDAGIDVTIYEASSRFGGKIATDRVDGFTIERGADSFVVSRPRILDLCKELGLESELMPPDPRHRGAFISRHGHLHPIPEGFSGLVPTKFRPILTTRLLSPLGKLRMLMELSLPVNHTAEDESLQAFVIRRFGKEAYFRMLEPLLTGISASDGHDISLVATFPHWKTAELEHGSVIRGILAARPGQTSTPRVTGFLSLRNGMSSLVTALEHRLRSAGAQLFTGATVQDLVAGVEGGYTLTVDEGSATQLMTFDGVIFALPAWEAATILETIEPDASAALRDIPQRSSGVVSLGYTQPSIGPRLKGTGYLIPRIEGRPASGTTYSSAKWHNRAADGTTLIRVYFGRGKGQEVLQHADDQLVAVAQEELRQTLGITEAPATVHVTRWTNSMPQYTIGHLDRVSTITQLIAGHRGLALAGNMLRGIGVPICVQNGETAAEEVASALTRDETLIGNR